MFHLKRILVPVDFSDESELALRSAVITAQAEQGSRIYLLHVLPLVVDPAYLTNWSEDLVMLREKEARKELARFAAKIPNSVRRISVLRRGKVVDQIRWLCEERSIDVVFMVNRGRHGVGRLVNPNASEEAVRILSCPVVVLHLNQQTTKAVETHPPLVGSV